VALLRGEHDPRTATIVLEAVAASTSVSSVTPAGHCDRQALEFV
jgi:hypothetical protein